MKSFLIVVSIALLTSAAQAASFKLDANGAEPLYQTTLPKEVYQYSSSNHLQDLSIINANGESVPYALVPYENMFRQTKITETSKPLVIFPMQEETLKQAGVTNIQLNNHNSSTSINVLAEDSKPVSKTYYLFDLGQQPPAFKKLTFDWEGQQGQLFSVDIMTSNDLKSWTKAGEAVLVKVSANNEAIVQNSVIFDQLIKARYLQIRPHETTGAFALTAVNLEFNVVQEVTQPILWQSISFLERTKRNTDMHVDFESSSRYPATYLTITLPQQNTITHATVLTRNHDDQPWQIVSSSALFRLNKQGTEVTNKEIHIPKTTARYWRLTFNQDQGGIGNDNPQLSLGWLPDVLVWNARGTNPFTLYVGEPNKEANRVAIMHLLKPYGVKKPQELPFSNLTLSSLNQDDNTWDSPADVKRRWLWGGLFVGVLALAIMAYSLVKKNP